MYTHIVIPIDGSPAADKAIEAGIEPGRSAKAKVTLFTALPPGGAEPMARRPMARWDHERISRDKAQAILRPAEERLRDAGVDCATHAVLEHSSIPTLVYR